MDNLIVPKLWTVGETATALRVNEDTVRSMVREGTLPGFVIGKKCIRIREADVVNLLTGKGV